MSFAPLKWSFAYSSNFIFCRDKSESGESSECGLACPDVETRVHIPTVKPSCLSSPACSSSTFNQRRIAEEEIRRWPLGSLAHGSTPLLQASRMVCWLKP